ncbi:hypothetical protein CAPTEDRAFT_204665 [Capitella teleta]|uniref:Uncharacterized protein n=1 Tax=Capitella teleta TaxID=283909 RepID=R7UDF3_CAPTE|nr:hypothetical protein CAPTEDRAFT_204665 [Capitella teleta]|eukprot:ELU01823.1 hypothetical protein CAPTEDRAFT_204665 [Capitella teleta]
MHRGGCALLIRHRMVKYIVKVDVPDPECIMLKLQLFPKITFVSCYIAPSDSPYHSFAPLSEIQERNIQSLMDIAEELGRPSTQQDPSNNVSLHQRRMIKMSQIDPQLAADALNTTSPPDLTLDDTDTIVDEVNNMLYNIASNARITTSPAPQRTDADVRWKYLLENNDSRTLWKAVNLNGSIASPEKDDRPNDDVFRVHFEELLNPKCRTANTPCARYIRSLDQHDYDHEDQILKEKARTSTRTKYRSYCNPMNPELKKHEIYTDINVKEYARLTTTRFRLSSHNLAIECGRWLRKRPEKRV